MKDKQGILRTQNVAKGMIAGWDKDVVDPNPKSRGKANLKAKQPSAASAGGETAAGA